MKHSIKYFLDLTLLLDLVALAVTGFLLGFVIPVGRVPYSEKYFLGLHRHLWANIHLSLALLFLLLILLHLGLNWNWLVSSSGQYFQRGCHKGLWALLTAVLLIFAVGWLAVNS